MGAEIILPGSHEDFKPAEEEHRISLKDFLKTREADLGTIITGVKPIDLFTYQSWLDDSKIANVLNYAEMQSPELNQITGYIQYHPKLEKNIMVIGNGNHRALYAIAMGRTIDLAVEKPTILHKENPFRLTNVIKKHGNPFVNL
jgi:hypothetical protein